MINLIKLFIDSRIYMLMYLYIMFYILVIVKMNYESKYMC